MRIAILGPISTTSIKTFLSSPPPSDFPAGVSGAPLMATLIGSLLDRGHEVIAVTSGGYEATRDSRPVVLEGDRFKFYCCPARKRAFRYSNGRVGRMADFFAYERKMILAALKESKPDVVHAHWTYEHALAAIDSGFPYLITAHDDPLTVLRMYKNAYRLGRYFMARMVLHKAIHVSAVSDDLAGRLSCYSRCQISAIPNPLDTQFCNAGAARQGLTGRANIQFISVMNGWSYLKNAQSALIAFNQILAKYPYSKLHMYGHDYEANGKAHNWAVRSGLESGVLFHGAIAHNELVTALKNADVLIHASRWEECPMGIAEAMATGLPVIGGSNSGGVAWMVGNAGLLVDINSPTQMAHAMEQLIGDEALYQRCSCAAIERVREFKPDHIASLYEAAYHQAIRQQAPPLIHERTAYL